MDRRKFIQTIVGVAAATQLPAVKKVHKVNVDTAMQGADMSVIALTEVDPASVIGAGLVYTPMTVSINGRIIGTGQVLYFYKEFVTKMMSYHKEHQEAIDAEVYNG